MVPTLTQVHTRTTRPSPRRLRPSGDRTQNCPGELHLHQTGATMSLLRPCIDCGELSERSRCEAHRPQPHPKASSTQRGYDWQWRKLSERARRLQPFCTDCGATTDLQTDHTPEAWERHAKGLEIRLEHVAVVCGPCNIQRGQARPGDEGQNFSQLDPLGKSLT